MSFGRVGIIRALILCGAGVGAALLPGGSAALARHHHTHHHSSHIASRHETPKQSGTTPDQTGAAKPGGAAKAGGAAAISGATAGAAPTVASGGLEFVPGPLPVPQASTERGMSNRPPAGGAVAPAKDRPPAAKDQSGAAEQGEPPAKVASSITIAPTPVAARSAIDTAVAKLFLGDPVYGARGEPIGNLTEIVPGPDGQVKSVVITWGGLLGYFQSRRTIGWPDAGPTIQGGKLVLQGFTKAALHSTETPQSEARR